MSFLAMHNLNLTLLYIINGVAGTYSSVDTAVLFLTNNLAYIVCIGVAIYMVIWHPLKVQDLQDRLRAFRQSILFVFSVLTTVVVVQAIKVIIALPRPFQVLASINALAPYESGYSFPSAHAAITVAIATATFFYHRRLGIILYVFALIVALSRIYVGVHYPIDVVAGAVLGWGIAYILHRVTTHAEVADQSKTS